MNISVIVICLLIVVSTNIQLTVQFSELKCLVCRGVVNEITSAVLNEDPRKKIQVGSFRIQPDGSQNQAQIKYAGSEIHLNEILETVCNVMDDFAQFRHKETGELVILNLNKDIDKLDIYQPVPDPDINRSLKFYCQNFIEDYEDSIISTYKTSQTSLQEEESQITEKLCSVEAGYCSFYHKEL